MNALFLDRDGVINRMVHYNTGYDSPQNTNDVVLIANIEKVIKFANDKKILVIEVSNQPGYAKGKLSETELYNIDEYISKLLEDKGAKIDFRYICKHHPNAMIPTLAVQCDCRKPKPGLLLQAAKDLKISLEQSIFYGDKNSDVLAGKAAGCKTMILLHNEDTKEKVQSAYLAPADYKVTTHLEALIVLKNLFI